MNYNAENALIPIWNYLTDFLGEIIVHPNSTIQVTQEEFINFCLKQVAKLVNEPNKNGELFENVVTSIIYEFDLSEYGGDDSPGHIGYIRGIILGCLLSYTHIINPNANPYTIVWKYEL